MSLLAELWGLDQRCSKGPSIMPQGPKILTDILILPLRTLCYEKMLSHCKSVRNHSQIGLWSADQPEQPSLNDYIGYLQVGPKHPSPPF